MPLELRKLTAKQLGDLNPDMTIFFFPVGPLEDHGPHLPLGLDLDEANQLCWKTAARLEGEKPGWTGVVLPAAPLGIDSNTTQLALTVRPYVLRDWLFDCCRALIHSGFIHFVVYSGNLGPRQLTAIEEAGHLVRKFGRWHRWLRFQFGSRKSFPSLVSASSALVEGKDVVKSPFWPDPVEHGGQRDTSIALALDPSLVDPSFENLPEIKRMKSRWARNLRRRLGKMNGYWGNPSGAQSESGIQTIQDTLNTIFPKLRAMLEGANTRTLFRSWYASLPPNKSFFKAWLLAGLVLIMLGSWCYLSFLAIQVE